jgi:hypothetical protein
VVIALAIMIYIWLDARRSGIERAHATRADPPRFRRHHPRAARHLGGILGGR